MPGSFPGKAFSIVATSVIGRCSFPARSDERFVYIAPSPVLTGLERLDDRMGSGVGVLPRVLHR
jgi:hypothetical protein